MDRIGIIGAGEVGQAVAAAAVVAGRDVLLAARRQPEALAPVARSTGAVAGRVDEAASRDVVVLAVRWRDAPAVLSALPDGDDRILIDATNPFVRFDPPELDDLGDRSASVVLAELVNGWRVVKAFNSATMANFRKGPKEGSATRALFVSGDDPEAKRTVAALITDMGYAAVDLGNLESGGRLQQAGGPLAGLDVLLA